MSKLGNGRRLPTVLIIDDDMVSREVMATVLTMSGYTVHTAPGGSDAVEMLALQACTPEVILMDTQMPGLSGQALIQQLRLKSPAVLYAMSGSHAPEAVTEGADGFLMKPFGPEALQRLLEQHTQENPHKPADSVPVIDPETLAQWRELMPESAVRDIYVAVLSDLERRIASLEQAIAAGDAAKIKRIGHAVKGGCGMAGVQQASRIAAELELGGDDLEYSAHLLARLRAATADLQRMLDAEFPPPGPTSVG